MGQISAQADREQALLDVFTLKESKAVVGESGSGTRRGPSARSAGIVDERTGTSFMPAGADSGPITLTLVAAGIAALARAVPWWVFALIVALGVVITH